MTNSAPSMISTLHSAPSPSTFGLDPLHSIRYSLPSALYSCFSTLMQSALLSPLSALCFLPSAYCTLFYAFYPPLPNLYSLLWPCSRGLRLWNLAAGRSPGILESAIGTWEPGNLAAHRNRRGTFTNPLQYPRGRLLRKHCDPNQWGQRSERCSAASVLLGRAIIKGTTLYEVW